MNIEDYPIKIQFRQTTDATRNRMSSRAESNGKLYERSGSDKMKSTFINDAIVAWNKAPNNLRVSKTLFSAKRQIKTFVRTLPTLATMHSNSKHNVSLPCRD